MSSGVGIQELVLLFVIGLLILGPERLPRVASQIGRWVGRARRTANQLRYQLEREIALADIEKSVNSSGSKSDGKPAGSDKTTGSSESAGSDKTTAGDDAGTDESPPEAAAASASPASPAEETIAGTAAAGPGSKDRDADPG